MRYPTGTTDQYLYFVAVDSTDLKTRETGLTTFTVVRSRNGAADVTYTTPTVAEIDATTMPGVYTLLLDEDMTIGAGNDSEEVCLHITQASMAPVTRVFELYRRPVSDGETVTVSSGAVSTVASVTAVATGGITAGSIAADAIGASELAADAVTEIVNGVWDVDATGHQTQGTFGQAIGDPAADTNTIFKAVVSDATGATVGVDAAAILVDTTEIGVAGAGLTAIDLPNQTMDITGNITGNLSGSVGSVTGAVGSVTAGVTLAASAVQAIWDALTAALTTVGSIGKLLVDNVNATIGSRATQTSVDDIPTNVELATEINSVQTDIAALNNISTAQVNAEVVDALNVDSYGEPTGVPAASAPLSTKIGNLYEVLRNKVTVTGTKLTVYNDSDAAQWEKDLSDDGTTYTESEANAI